MIRLTGTNGTAIYMNPDKIISFNEDDGETFIDYGYDRYIVTEPATEVARKGAGVAVGDEGLLTRYSR